MAQTLEDSNLTQLQYIICGQRDICQVLISYSKKNQKNYSTCEWYWLQTNLCPKLYLRFVIGFQEAHGLHYVRFFGWNIDITWKMVSDVNDGI